MRDIDRRRFIRLSAAALAATALPGVADARETCTQDAGVRHCHTRLRQKMVLQSAKRQHMSQWCWAAALSMIFGYYGHPVSQERIVRDAWGRAADMPRHVDEIMRDINRNWTDDNGKRFSVSGKKLTLHHLALPRHAARAISKGQPLIVGSLGHATVLTEMRWEEDADGSLFVTDLIVSDPVNGKRRNLTVEERLQTAFVAAVDVRTH